MATASAAPIVVLGADGYLGWPLSMRLARRNPERKILMVDNFLRRRLVREVGGSSVLPILESRQRLWACRTLYGITNLEFIQLDVNSQALHLLLADRRPAAIYHLAQQCSAPYAMSNCESALDTLRNNEEGNLRLLWAVRELVPDCHIIKLGTFGEYAKGGLDIAEGYFQPEYRGKKASKPIPYPRQSEDFYHASKINDTNYISVACQQWGLRVTDIMQSTVFGTWTEDIGDHADLYTRFDHDEYFGTVANRFIAQALIGAPLSVYGTGHQRTGLMALNDSIASLASLWDDCPDSGQHRVINHVTEKSFSVNELADAIVNSANREGLDVQVQCGSFDPRGEQDPHKQAYGIESDYLDAHPCQTAMEEVVHKSFRMLMPYRQRIDRRLFAPRQNWREGTELQSRCGEVVVPFVGRMPGEDERTPSLVDSSYVGVSNAPDCEEEWELFRREQFPCRHLNLNPGTFGAPSERVLKQMRGFQSRELLSQPLHEYSTGREIYLQARQEAENLWPAPEHSLQLVSGASQCSNLLALAFARLSGRMRRSLRVLTTANEHAGGIGAFERMPEFELRYLSEKEASDPAAFKSVVGNFKPDIAFFSHIAYDRGHEMPVSAWMRELKAMQPAICCVLDVSQSIGMIQPRFDRADVVFGSCHKWLFGPRGTGLIWTNERFRKLAGALNWSGEPLLESQPDVGFAPAGGQDFSLYSGLLACFRLYGAMGEEVVRRRSANLALFFRVRLTNLLRGHGIRFCLLEPQVGGLGANGMFTVSFLNHDPYPLYHAMNQQGVHCKCIKSLDQNGQERNLLRFGIPYFETEARLQEGLAIIEDCLRGELANSPDKKLRYLLQSGQERTRRAPREALSGVRPG